MQNSPVVPPGTILDYFDKQEISYEVIKTYDKKTWGKLNDFRAMIILGSPHSAMFYSQSEHLAKLFRFASEAVHQNLPVLGICFGSQLLAMILGGVVMQSETMELGQTTIQLTDAGTEDPLFHDCEKELSVFHWHRDRWQLPDKAELLATSGICPRQVFRAEKAVGIQFHPEVNREIVESWCEEFAPDLEANKKSPEEIIRQYDEMADDLKQLNFRILDGFLSGTKKE